jgi:rubrerythrin
MQELKGSKTHENLNEAFSRDSQANRRYLYFAQKADIAGYPDVAALFRSVADAETGHAFGHLDFLADVGDPVTEMSVGATEDNLRSAIEAESYECTEMYPGFARSLATRASTTSPSGSRPWPARRRATRAGSPKGWSRSREAHVNDLTE